eukprot:Colp12_sorted_trinity150504_noHs@23023
MDLSLRPVEKGLSYTPTPVGNFGVHDTLRLGLHQAKDDLSSAHPVKYIQENSLKTKEQQRFNMLSRTHGQHFPMKLQMERNLVTQARRLPGLHTSNVALETLLGLDECIEYEDFLNDPREQERMPADVHTLMEKRMGWSFYQ